jgi:hypothetical protein
MNAPKDQKAAELHRQLCQSAFDSLDRDFLILGEYRPGTWSSARDPERRALTSQKKSVAGQAEDE